MELSLYGNLSPWQVLPAALLMNIRKQAVASYLGRPQCHASSSISIRRAGHAEPNEEKLVAHTNGDGRQGVLSRLYKDPDRDPVKTRAPKTLRLLTVRNPTQQNFYQLLILLLTSPKARWAQTNEELWATF